MRPSFIFVIFVIFASGSCGCVHSSLDLFVGRDGGQRGRVHRCPGPRRAPARAAYTVGLLDVGQRLDLGLEAVDFALRRSAIACAMTLMVVAAVRKTRNWFAENKGLRVVQTYAVYKRLATTEVPA